VYALVPLDHFSLYHHLKFGGHVLSLISSKTNLYISDVASHFAHNGLVGHLGTMHGKLFMVFEEMDLVDVASPCGDTIT
jgi:hypothetical protein